MKHRDDGFLAINAFAAAVRAEIDDLLSRDMDEASMWTYRLDRIVGLCSEMKAKVIRRAKQDSEHPREACPVVEIAEWGRR